MKSAYILVIVQSLAGQTDVEHKPAYDTRKECMTAGELSLNAMEKAIEASGKSGASVWFYCQPALGTDP